MKHRQWRLIPKVSFHNWCCNPNWDNISANCFKRWFSIQRFCGGRIIYICVRNYMVEFDFRYDWLKDLSPDQIKWVAKRVGIRHVTQAAIEKGQP